MAFEEPTYEEYARATSFAKFRYKYGMVVTFACWLALVFLIYYIVVNGEALGTNPMKYAMEKSDLECHCYRQGTDIDFYVNSTTSWIAKEGEFESNKIDKNWLKFLDESNIEK